MRTGAFVWNTYGLPIVMVAACVITIVAVARHSDTGTPDFRAFYESGRQYLAGTDPYIPFDPDRGANLNPPWIVAMMSQLCLVPLPIAVVVWWLFSFACLFAAINLIARTVAPGQMVTIASVALATQSAYSNIRLGQVVWPVMLLLTAAWRADRWRRPVLSGALLGLAVSWKPFLIVFLPYLVWRRAWTMLAALSAVIAATVAASLLVVGGSGHHSWLTVLRLVKWEGHVLNGSIAGFLARALKPEALVTMSDWANASTIWLNLLWVAIGLIALAITARTIRAATNPDVAWASLTLLAILLSPLGWVHYALLGTGPIIAVLINAPSVSRLMAVTGWLLICNPLAWILPGNESGPLMMLTVGSSYTWGTVLLLGAVLVAGSPSQVGSTSSSPPGAAMTHA